MSALPALLSMVKWQLDRVLSDASVMLAPFVVDPFGGLGGPLANQLLFGLQDSLWKNMG